MMHAQRLRFGLAIAVTLAFTACTPIRTFVDRDPAADFSSYASYCWISDDPLIQPHDSPGVYVSELNLQRIENAIESELSAKGYVRCSGHDADFVVSYTVGERDRIDVNAYPSVYHTRWGHWPYFGDTVDVRSYTEGMLAIDIFDHDQRKPVWHGVARKRVTGEDAENAGAAIKEAVAAILEEFPQRSGS